MLDHNTPSSTSPPHDVATNRHLHNRRIARLAASISLLFAFALTAASLPARSWWVADVLANVRVQACIATASLLALCTLLRLKIHLILACLLLVWHASFLAPAFISASTTPDIGIPNNIRNPTSTADFSICVANVRFDNPHHNVIANSLRNADADVLVVIEATQKHRQALTQLLESTHPHMVWADRDPGAFGIGVLSRLPILHPRIQDFGAPQSSGPSSKFPAISAEISTPAGPVNLIAIHCMPPIGQYNFQLRSRQLANAAKAAANRPPDSRILLVGDLNLTPWAPAFQDLVNHSKLLNAAAGQGIEPTWNAGPRYPCGLLIDHILHSSNLTPIQRLILPPLHSDHRPVFARFRISNPAPQRDSAAQSASHPYSQDPPPGMTP